MQRIARATLRLLKKDPREWIDRRVETITFLDHKSAHHAISVDFTLPAETEPVGIVDGEPFYIAPLFLLAKEASQRNAGETVPRAPYVDLTLTDAAGTRLPLITRSQSNQIAANVLIQCARDAIGPLSGDQKTTLSTIAATKRSRPLVKQLLDSYPKLADHSYFPDLAFMLARHSLVICRFTGMRPGRTLLQLCYDEPFGKSNARWWETLFRSFGWKSHQAVVSLNEIGASATYRVEIDTPKELEINATGLVGTRYEMFGPDPRTLNNQQREYDIYLTKDMADANVYVPEPLPTRRVGVLWVKLRACRPGFLRSALAAAVINSMVLWAVALNADGLVRADRSEAAVALLLLLPAILAAYVARPDEHTFTTKILTGSRIMLVFVAALPFAAALFLMTTPNMEERILDTVGTGSGPGVVTTTMNRAYTQAQQIEAQREAATALTTEHAISENLRKKWMILAMISFVLAAQFAAVNIWPRPRGTSRYKVKASG